MVKTVEDLEQDLATVWSIVNELSEQLGNNNQLLSQLRTQSTLVKGQAVHTGVGFPLRRFNIDISDEEFSTQLEEFASHLVLENQTLTYENKQLNILLKDYETVLEGVMGKFRSVSHASTKHELSLHQYYTSLLHSLRTAQSSQQLLDSTTLSLLLQRLSTLIRMALRNVNGEEDGDGPIQREEWELLGAAAASIEELNLGAAYSPQEDSSQTFSPATSISGLPSTARPVTAGRVVRGDRSDTGSTSHPPRAPSTIGYDSWQGNMTPSGGYTGTFGRRDWALDREGEIVRLTSENTALREMLGIEADVDVEALLQRSRIEVETKRADDAKREAEMVDIDLADDKLDIQGYDVDGVSGEKGDEQEQSGKSTGTALDRSSPDGQVVDAEVVNQDEEPKDFFSTSPKHSVSRLSMKSPKLAKHHTYAGIPTTATTPLSPSAIREVSMAGKLSEGLNRDKGSHATAPPGLSTHASSGNLSHSTHSNNAAPHASTSTLSSLLIRPGGKAKTKTEPTTATSIGVDLDDNDTASPPLASYAAIAKPQSKAESAGALKDGALPVGVTSPSEKAGDDKRKSSSDDHTSPAARQPATEPQDKPETATTSSREDYNESAILDDEDEEDVGESGHPVGLSPGVETYAEVVNHEHAQDDSSEWT